MLLEVAKRKEELDRRERELETRIAQAQAANNSHSNRSANWSACARKCKPLRHNNFLRLMRILSCWSAFTRT